MFHCLALSCLWLVSPAVLAEKPAATQPDDAAVREAVSKSLPFLEKGGVAWMNDRGCMSCHHVPFLLWSHRAAQTRGLTVDAKKLANWEEWSRKDSLSHRNQFYLDGQELAKVDVASLPDDVKKKLKPLTEQRFQTEAEFIAKMKALLTEGELKSYRAIITKTGELRLNHLTRNGGGMEVVAHLLLGGHGTSSILAQPDFRDGTIALMRKNQLADDSWVPGNQIATLRRWSLPTAHQVTTMWVALAQDAYATPGAKRSDAIEKAIAYQRKQTPQPDNREWLASRLLFERQFGSADEVAKLRRQLLDARNNDGGWGWEKGVSSDSHTTGLAIYVLAKVQSGDNAAAIRDARKYLLASQQADGSWLTPAKNISNSTDPERLKVRDKIYQYWGTGWAAVGLLETLGTATK